MNITCYGSNWQENNSEFVLAMEVVLLLQAVERGVSYETIYKSSCRGGYGMPA